MKEEQKANLRTGIQIFSLLLAGAVLLAGSQLTAVRGTVKDAAGTPLRGARIVVSSDVSSDVTSAVTNATGATSGVSRSTVSNEAGDFQIEGLPPGLYAFEISLRGFVSAAQQGVEVRAGNPLALSFVLQQTGVLEQAGSPDKGAVAENLIDESQISGLPLNGRSYSQLATLQAGISDSSSSSSSRGIGGGSLSVAGGRTFTNTFLLDGTNIMNTMNQAPRSAAGVQLGSDTVLEVQVFSSFYGAEYGRNSGGMFNAITRSGSDEFHGTVFEFLRNSKLDARNFFDRDSEPPPFKRNQFGFTLSGPLRQGKSFFLVSYEGLRDRLHQTNVNFFPDETAGIDGNLVPKVAESVKPYLALYPIPNDVKLRNGVARHISAQFLPTNENFLTVRVDQKVSDRDSFFVRYTFDDATGNRSNGTSLFRSQDESRQQYLTLVETHIFSPGVLDTFRFGYTRPVNAIVSEGTLEIPPELFFSPLSPQFGQIQIPGLSPLGPAPTNPLENLLNTFQFANDVLIQRGAHLLKFGLQFQRNHWNSFSKWNMGGVWSFNSLKDFLQAGPVGTRVTVALPGSDNRHAYRQSLFGFYVQDEFRSSQRLQLTLGLRYEPATLLKDKLGKIPFMPDPVRDTEVRTGAVLANNPFLTNFSPRLGITWSPWEDKNLVLRTGGGVYYDQPLGYLLSQRKSSAPFYNVVVTPNLEPPSFRPFPDALQAAAGVPPQVHVTDYFGAVAPRVYRYHFTLQQSLNSGWRWQAAYVGSRGNHLLRRYETNQFPVPITRDDGSLFFPGEGGPTNPSFESINFVGTDAQSSYNALQLSANKSLGQGLSLRASYSYSKSVDDSSVGHTASRNQYGLRRTLDRGLSDFDLRHRLVFNYFYSLPFGSGQRWGGSGFLSKIAGGWRVGGILTLRSGTPFTARVNVRTRGFLFSPSRPNLVPGKSNNPAEGTTAGCGNAETGIVEAGQKLGGPELYFDPCSFSVPEAGTLGNVGRNTLISPSVFNMDVSLQREFLLDSKRRLQLRADIFNLPNHSNFTSSSPVVFSGEAGRRTSTAGRITKTSTTSRQIQFALRFSF